MYTQQKELSTEIYATKLHTQLMITCKSLHWNNEHPENSRLLFHVEIDWKHLVLYLDFYCRKHPML